MKARQIKKIKFWTLRNSIGASGGVIFDNDVEVVRLCRVVRVAAGLKWQLVKNKFTTHFDEIDQECLNNLTVEE